MNYSTKYEPRRRNTLTQFSSNKGKSKSNSKLKQTILQNCQTGERYFFALEKQLLFIGSSLDCDIVLRDPFASSKHCALERLGDSWQLRDLGSKNGTHIAGTRIDVAELKPGSPLIIGGTKLELVKNSNCTIGRSKLVGKSKVFLDAVELAIKAARSSCSVLLLGETGTGKELFARLIHEASRRESQPYVPVNCAAIPNELVCSELFGHTRGSFTGATNERDGHFKQAHLGTLFLDEIGELPKNQQTQLLRALETGLIRKVGASLEQLVDVRVVAATNQNCSDLRFSPLREDLYHRVSNIVIKLPSLRERKEDIPLLIERFLEDGIEEFGPCVVSDKIKDQLAEHRWSGNVRELRNGVRRAMAMHTGTIELHHFLPQGIEVNDTQSEFVEEHDVSLDSLNLTAYQVNQRKVLSDAYVRYGTIRAASEELGIPKSTFADLCRRLGIETKRRKK